MSKTQKKQKLTSRKRLEALDKRFGVTPAPKNHPIFSEDPSITLSSHTQKPSQEKRTPQTPLSILDAPIESTPMFIKHDEVIPGVRVPKYLPRDSVFIAQVEWPLRPGDTRVEAYFIGSNSHKKHWFLMECTVDDLSPHEPRYLSRRTIAMVDKCQLNVEEAAVLLLNCAWQYEKGTWGTPAFFMVSNFGLLDLTTVNEIADIVWPTEDGGAS